MNKFVNYQGEVKSLLKYELPALFNVYRWLRRLRNPYFDVPKTHLPLQKRIDMNMRLYKIGMGYGFDIGKPRTFTEKIQWYKMFYREDLGYMVDKVAFKNYISKELGDGWTIPIIGSWTSIEDLERDWESLPEEFCLKSSSCDDGKNIKFIHHKSGVSFKKLKRELRTWLDPMNTLQNSNCIAYKNVVPKILAEQFMSNFKDQLYDYKFFCFDGQPYCMYVATEHFDKENYPITFYDLEWNIMPIRYGSHETATVPRPPHFEDMKEIAKKLSAGHPFLRVDFFDTEDKLYLAELTLYPGGGVVPYHPDAFNEEMGDKFHIPCELNS